MHKKPKNHKKISVAPIHYPAKKSTHQAGVEMQNARRTAALIWESWQKAMQKLALEEKLDAADLPRHLNDLAARIQKEIKNETIRESTLIMIDKKIVDLSAFLSEFKLVLENTVNVIAHCPHELSIHGVKSFCDWTARVRIDRKEFADGTAKVECGSCGKEINCDEMTLPEESGRSAA